jgi:predicted RNase H-like HicB family nuclease
MSENNWGAYVPDLPGLGVGGRTKDEVEQWIEERIILHIEV